MMGLNRQSLLKVVILSALILILYGCGDIGGGGQGGGSGDSGLYLAVTGITPNDTINSQETSAVDVVQNIDCAGDGSGTVEPFGDHDADVTLSLSLVEGATSPPAADKVYINRYTIDYTVNPGSSGPSLNSEEYYDNIEVASGSTATATLKLVDMIKKAEYVNNGGVTSDCTDITSNCPVYTLTYNFYGEDEYGNDISAGAYTTITIGNYDVCSS